MIINNFEQIKSLLSFESSDCFYHLQIIKRKKDCEEHAKGQNNSARCVKTYYIKSIEYLESKETEIIALCELFQARAYINLNTKSLRKSAYELNSLLADRLKYDQLDYISRGYETVVGGKDVNIGEKKWLLDIDTKDMSEVVKVVNAVRQCRSNKTFIQPINGFDEGYYDNIITSIPTASGYHLITYTFNLKELEEFRKVYPFDIQKNNPTLLYFNKKKDGETN